MGVEAAGRILHEFAHHQLGDVGNAGMCYYFPMQCMQSASYCARIRQVSSRATSRVSGRRTFHEYFGQNGVNMGPRCANIAESPAKTDNLTAKVLGLKTSEIYIVKKSTFYLLTALQLLGYF